MYYIYIYARLRDYTYCTPIKSSQKTWEWHSVTDCRPWPLHPRDLDAKCPQSARFESPNPRATPHDILHTRGGRYQHNLIVYTGECA